jgi:hypothetical protein
VSTCIYNIKLWNQLLGKSLAIGSSGANHFPSAGSGINAYNVEDPSAIQLLQTEYYGSPGDNQPSPQDVAHPHQAVVDPTGEFLVFPDLGADKIRVFKVNQETLALETKVRHVLPLSPVPREANHGLALRANPRIGGFRVSPRGAWHWPSSCCLLQGR